MLKPRLSEDWDKDFSHENAQTVTLRDTNNKLYCVSAHLLAVESGFFKDMFSAIPPRNDETIDVDLPPPSLKRLLRYLHVAYARDLPSVRDTCLRLFDIVDLAEFYVWCKKYQFEKLAKAAIATIPSLDLKGKPWARNLACVLLLAQDADDIQLGRTAIEMTSTCPGPFLDFMEAARTRLSPSWLDALQWGVMRIESEGLSSTARGSSNFAKRLSELFAEELQNDAKGG